jgi:DNA repair exonuclease SbcCD ATPase subunit
MKKPKKQPFSARREITQLKGQVARLAAALAERNVQLGTNQRWFKSDFEELRTDIQRMDIRITKLNDPEYRSRIHGEFDLLVARVNDLRARHNTLCNSLTATKIMICNDLCSPADPYKEKAENAA